MRCLSLSFFIGCPAIQPYEYIPCAIFQLNCSRLCHPGITSFKILTCWRISDANVRRIVNNDPNGCYAARLRWKGQCEILRLWSPVNETTLYAQNYVSQNLHAVSPSIRSYGSRLIRFKCGRKPLGKMEMRVWTMRGLSMIEGWWKVEDWLLLLNRMASVEIQCELIL